MTPIAKSIRLVPGAQADDALRLHGLAKVDRRSAYTLAAAGFRVLVKPKAESPSHFYLLRNRFRPTEAYYDTQGDLITCAYPRTSQSPAAQAWRRRAFDALVEDVADAIGEAVSNLSYFVPLRELDLWDLRRGDPAGVHRVACRVWKDSRLSVALDALLEDPHHRGLNIDAADRVLLNALAPRVPDLRRERLKTTMAAPSRKGRVRG